MVIKKDLPQCLTICNVKAKLRKCNYATKTGLRETASIDDLI